MWHSQRLKLEILPENQRRVDPEWEVFHRGTQGREQLHRGHV